MDNEKEISFGAFDSELMHQEIYIPEGFEATIEGNKIILKKTESDDVKIRKELIKVFSNREKYLIDQSFGDITVSEALTWLEKQGEQKPIDKIQLGKKYKCIASPRYSTFRRGNIYKPVDNFLCNLMNLCYECFEPIEDSEQKPTDEDMKEALRTEYEKGRADAFAQMQKEWSEEDEEMFEYTISLLNYNLGCRKWLKSLKERYTWKPSDKQMHAFEQVYDWYNNNFAPSETLTSLYKDLEKLKGE